jgi:hypothetical protein
MTENVSTMEFKRNNALPRRERRKMIKRNHSTHLGPMYFLEFLISISLSLVSVWEPE